MVHAIQVPLAVRDDLVLADHLLLHLVDVLEDAHVLVEEPLEVLRVDPDLGVTVGERSSDLGGVPFESPPLLGDRRLHARVHELLIRLLDLLFNVLVVVCVHRNSLFVLVCGIHPQNGLPWSLGWGLETCVSLTDQRLQDILHLVRIHHIPKRHQTRFQTW